LAAKHGFESVGADAWFMGGLSDEEISKLKSDVADKGLVWGSAGLPVEFRKDEAKFREDLSGLAKRAAALQKVGVTRMGTWIIPCHDELTYVQNFKQHATRLRECAKILKDNGLRFGLEYVGPQTLRISKRFPFLHTMKETRELNAEIGVDNMGLIMDSWHWYTAGETAADLATLTNQEIVACDLNDAPKDKTVNEQMDLERELPMATGVIDLKTFLEGLVAAGYDGPVRAEPFNQTVNEMENDEACKATQVAIESAFDLVGG
jgi:sugar phosphate isomerase/epimerase